MKNLLIMCGITFLFMACETPVYFEEPQPLKGKTANQFSKKYIGKYKSATKKGIFLEIQKTKILTERFWKRTLTKTALDTLSGYEWRNNDLYYYEKRQETTIKGDTVLIHKHSKDTYFTVDETHVLKSYKGSFFLNQEYLNGWEVQKLGFSSKNKLVLSEISSNDEIEHLQEVTEVDAVMYSDTSDNVKYYKLNPTDKEFDDILNEGIFTVEDIYIKIE